MDTLFGIGKCNVEGMQNFTGGKQHEKHGINQ